MSHSWLLHWKTGTTVAPSTWGHMREGTVRSSQRHTYLCFGGRRLGGKKKKREMGQKPTRRARSVGQMCRSCQCHQRQAWRWGGSHPFQTRRRTLDALPEAALQTHPDRSRHRQREILFSHFKNKESIRLTENGDSSAVLLLPGHLGCHPALGTGTWMVGMAVQVPRE